MVVQSMPDASPVRWHLAHATWFFETFVLARAVPRYKPFHPAYEALFNSYYETVGKPLPRPRRGTLSRPTVAEVMAWREAVDQRMEDLLAGAPERVAPHLAAIELGLHHEQQHQELVLMDVKHAFSQNPLRPVYAKEPREQPREAPPHDWVPFEGGRVEIGHAGEAFAYDNEGPRHETIVKPFVLATRLVTNEEYLAFMEDDGYARPELWMSDGIDVARREGWDAPLYWFAEGGEWWEYTLAGPRPVRPSEPVCHVSWYEAEAFAAWAGARLPLEAEWEVAAAGLPVEGNFVESGRLHPAVAPPPPRRPALTQVFGDVWEWTESPYVRYPGYLPPDGAFGEYNAKFMCNTWVLRGGCCATPQDHVRATYRNFFGPDRRWPFAGIRLARW
jgi:ergothioneine biosynthesis protein EgtB